MFEAPEKHSGLLWKILPVAVVAFGAILTLMIYLGESGPADNAPLTGILHAGDPDFDWYRKYVQLETRSMKMGQNFAGKRMVTFSGLIDNGGEKTLDVVEVRLTLFNYDDPVFEAIRTPVKPGPYTPAVGSLKQRGFAIYLEDLPGSWLASHAEMELHGFRFQKE